jgi:hypothetical protein
MRTRRTGMESDPGRKRKGVFARAGRDGSASFPRGEWGSERDWFWGLEECKWREATNRCFERRVGEKA